MALLQLVSGWIIDLFKLPWSDFTMVFHHQWIASNPVNNSAPGFLMLVGRGLHMQSSLCVKVHWNTISLYIYVDGICCFFLQWWYTFIEDAELCWMSNPVQSCWILFEFPHCVKFNWIPTSLQRSTFWGGEIHPYLEIPQNWAGEIMFFCWDGPRLQKHPGSPVWTCAKWVISCHAPCLVRS